MYLGGFTRHRDNHERRGRALLEFSGVIFLVNDAPDQSGVVVFGLEVHYFWIPICWYHMIVGEPHVQPGGMSRVYEIPVEFCKEPPEAPHGHTRKLKNSVLLIRRLPFSQMAHQSFSPIVLELFGRNGGPMAVTTAAKIGLKSLYLHICFALLITAIHPYFNPGTRFQVINETTLGLCGRCNALRTNLVLVTYLSQPEMPAASDPHREVWQFLWVNLGELGRCQLASVDKTDQQEAIQALVENFEMTESFTIRKPEDETSMQLFQI
ncbi:hypothetical protein B0H14DRAFT_2568190 [Mycena olivaceomarginata]|nr:hypothetical protein B0H14DRAFT_2568190 [Mycena olivaceomarginata]